MPLYWRYRRLARRPRAPHLSGKRLVVRQTLVRAGVVERCHRRRDRKAPVVLDDRGLPFNVEVGQVVMVGEVVGIGVLVVAVLMPSHIAESLVARAMMSGRPPRSRHCRRRRGRRKKSDDPKSVSCDIAAASANIETWSSW